MTLHPIQRRPTAADATEHPEIFNSCYWGNAQVDGRMVTPEIVANRNSFAKDYRLARPVFVNVGNTFRRDGVLDHFEAYQTREGAVVVLCSNYGALPPAHLGMVEIPRLYVTSARTFCKTFDTLKAARLALRDPGERR